ncbi:MAG: hypothetical protein U0Q15_03505 [Kineosporiaceae bacterium]
MSRPLLQLDLPQLVEDPPVPPTSVAPLVRALARALREAGAGRVSDTLILPVPAGWAGKHVRSTVTAAVRYRGHEERCFVRAATVPFDVLPYRVADPERDGAWFSIGPGTVPDQPGAGLHHAVVLVQVEGTAEDCARRVAPLRQVLRGHGVEPLETVVADAPQWHRTCLAGVLDAPGARATTWAGTP